jgi:hypothetical protein
MNIIINNLSNVIVSYSTGFPTPKQGEETLIELSEEQSIELENLFQTSKGGVKYENNILSALPYVEPEVITIVTAIQFKTALAQLDMLDNARAVVNSSNAYVQELWTSASEFHSNNPVLRDLTITGLGKTEADLANVFILARTIP